MINGMRLFLFLLTVRAYSQSTLASGFVIRNNDFMPIATADISNKKSNSNLSHMMRSFCKLHPLYVWCRNPNTTTSPTVTTEDGNVHIIRVKNVTVSDTVTSPTTTIINNWSTSDYDSLDLVTNNATSETTITTIINDHDELITSPMTYYTDDMVSTPTTLKSTTNYELNNTTSTDDTNILNNVIPIETTASVSTDYTNSTISSTESTTATKALDDVTLIETTTSVSTDYTDSPITSTESAATTQVLNNGTVIGTTVSAPTRHTDSANISNESTTTTKVLNNVSFGVTMAVPTCHIDIIYSLISLLFKYFCDCFKLHNFC